LIDLHHDKPLCLDVLNGRRLLPTIEKQHRKSPINARRTSQGNYSFTVGIEEEAERSIQIVPR
jgi:hypothetical protein